MSRREDIDVWIHTYVGDTIVTEANNQYTEIEAEITGLPIVEVDSFTAAIDEPVVKVLMVEAPERLIGIEKAAAG
ncbi:hypothetical protein GCM10020331_021610 [Ectobacillus funiculus]